jgi:chromosome segregation ATPase
MLDRDIQTLTAEGSQTTSRIQAKERDLQMMADKKSEKLRHIEIFDKDTAAAYDWIEKNRHVFEQPVYGPVLLELEVKDPRYTKYVATTLGYVNGRVRSIKLHLLQFNPIIRTL